MDIYKKEIIQDSFQYLKISKNPIFNKEKIEINQVLKLKKGFVQTIFKDFFKNQKSANNNDAVEY